MVQAAPERHLPQRARSWRISPRHALIASALCWIGFVLVASLVLSGHGSEIDSSGLLFWRRGADLVPAGPQWLLEAVRDLTALGGVLLRNLILIGVLAALLFLRLKREAVLLTATVMGGWLVNSLVKIAAPAR